MPPTFDAARALSLAARTIEIEVRALQSLAGEGYAILLSTHLPEQAWALQAQVALLAAGRLRGPAPAAELLTATELSQLYGTPVELLQVESGPAAGQRVCVPVFAATAHRSEPSCNDATA